jgi:ArsR family transcriptional regulator, arsenate/arsenite/antimonite-responsive transcriptional repressor
LCRPRTGVRFGLRRYFDDIRSMDVATKLERHAEQLHALGHPVRLSIIRILVQGGPAGTAAGDIQSRLEMPASTLSHHLSRLVQAGLITTRGEGTFHLYAPDVPALRALTNYLWQDCCKGGAC